MPVIPDYSPDMGITQSMLTNFLRCPQLAWYKLNGWQSRRKDPRILSYGSFIHLLLEEYHATDLYKQEDITDWLNEMEIEFGCKYLNGIRMGDATLEMIQMARFIFKGYHDYYRDRCSTWEFAALEEYFDVDFMGFRLRGLVDGLIRTNTCLYTWETKTSGRFDNQATMNKLQMNFQNMFYILGLTLNPKWDEKIHGSYYNVIRRPTLKGCPSRQNWQKLVSDTVARPSHYFQRFHIGYSRYERDIFATNLAVILEDYCNFVTDPDFPVYCNWTACAIYPNSPCEFMAACTTGRMDLYRQSRKLFSELEGRDDGQARSKVG